MYLFVLPLIKRLIKQLLFIMITIIDANSTYNNAIVMGQEINFKYCKKKMKKKIKIVPLQIVSTIVTRIRNKLQNDSK